MYGRCEPEQWLIQDSRGGAETLRNSGCSPRLGVRYACRLALACATRRIKRKPNIRSAQSEAPVTTE